jgi:hypothetical protein
MKEKYLKDSINKILNLKDKELAEKELFSLIEEVKISSYFQACNDMSRQNYKKRIQTQNTIDLAPNVFRLKSKMPLK